VKLDEQVYVRAAGQDAAGQDAAGQDAAGQDAAAARPRATASPERRATDASFSETCYAWHAGPDGVAETIERGMAVDAPGARGSARPSALSRTRLLERFAATLEARGARPEAAIAPGGDGGGLCYASAKAAAVEYQAARRALFFGPKRHLRLAGIPGAKRRAGGPRARGKGNGNP
jgi:hypothetical protein